MAIDCSAVRRIQRLVIHVLERITGTSSTRVRRASYTSALDFLKITNNSAKQFGIVTSEERLGESRVATTLLTHNLLVSRNYLGHIRRRGQAGLSTTFFGNHEHRGFRENVVDDFKILLGKTKLEGLALTIFKTTEYEGLSYTSDSL